MRLEGGLLDTTQRLVEAAADEEAAPTSTVAAAWSIRAWAFEQAGEVAEAKRCASRAESVSAAHKAAHQEAV